MNAKKYLKQAFFLNEEVNDSLLELERLRTIACSIVAVDTERDKIQSGKVSDIIGDSVPAIVDFEAEINSKIEECRAKKREIESRIKEIDDCKVQSVLLKRYIYFHEWDDIADDLKFTIGRIYQLHKTGLEEMQKIIVNYSKL